MPEITVTISKGKSQVSSKATEISTSSFDGLLSALKTVKEETNSVLSKLVEDSKHDSKQTRKSPSGDDSGSEGTEEGDDDDSARKKQKL